MEPTDEDRVVLENTRTKLQAHKDALATTTLWKETLRHLAEAEFATIRCLALGLPTLEFQALYQLAFLELLVEKYGVNVSLYDPAFTDADSTLLAELGHTVTAEFAPAGPTLYYMPHAPRSVTEALIRELEPTYILGNDITVTMGSLGKQKFLEQYPHLAKLVHMAEQKTCVRADDGFQRVSRRRRRPKNVYVEPELDYDFAVYFDDVRIVRIDAGSSDRWKDSFSDMALNVIVKRGRD